MEEKEHIHNHSHNHIGGHGAADVHDEVELDAAGKSLSEALRLSFITLKIIMVVLVIVFLASGFRTVAPDEEAIVLRFGKIRGLGEDRILKPGPHWIWPYPIDEIIKIPVEKNVDLAINSFWYAEIKRAPEKLNPVFDGYCITRSEKETVKMTGLAGNDYNIIHSKWKLTYKVNNPELFFKNIFVDTSGLVSGQNYSDVIAENVNPMLQSVFEDCVVTAMVNYTIDEARVSDYRIRKHVERLMQKKLDEIEAGVEVVTVLLDDIIWPRQVNDAFLASIKASQTSQKLVTEARGYAENTLNEAAGHYAEELLELIHGKEVAAEQQEFLWNQLAGAAQEKIAQARAYRTEVVENAKANAEYLQRILPEYKKRPELVIQKIYQETTEYVLNAADEKMVLQPTEGTKGQEIRVLLNRDPKLKTAAEQKKQQ